MFKKVFIILTIGIFFGGLALYLTRSFSPFDTNKLQTLVDQKQIEDGDQEMLDSEIRKIIDDGFIFEYLSKNAYVVFAITMSSIACVFIALHLMLDKFFFKKFYESPSAFDAVRRAIFLVIGLSLVLYLKLYGANTYTIAAVPLILLILEVFTMMNLRETLYNKVKRFRNHQSKS